MPDPTLNEALVALGYGSRDGRENYTKEVYRLDTGETVRRFTAHTCWQWIAEGCPAEEKAP